jgi:hypothetical protein
MKWISFFIVPLVMGLVGCSSKTVDTSAMTFQDKDKYEEVAENKLEVWEKKAEKSSSDRASALRAAINDTRVELQSLKTATPERWDYHKGRVDGRLSYLENRFSDLAE